MFSGFRNVMDSLAQPQPRPTHPGRAESQEFSRDPDRLERQHSRSGHNGSASFDISSVAQSTGNLAESAFLNLRKSLAVQRPFGASGSPSMEVAARFGSTSPQPERELKAVSKPALEDRLRASFAIGDASGSPTPSTSHAPSPRPSQPAASMPIQALSPKSTPLPDTPPISPLAVDLTSPPIQPLRLEDSIVVSHPLSGGDGDVAATQGQSLTVKDKGFRIDISPLHSRFPEADVPLPPFSPIPTNLSASQSHSSQASVTPLLESPLQPNGDAIQPNEAKDESNLLKARLSALEERLADTSSALERLTKSQDAANALLAELTPVSYVTDIEGLRAHFQNLTTKENLSQDEIKRLNGKLSFYDERIEELRDTHRLESRSQTELVDNLRKQLEESEALLKVAQDSASQAEEGTRKHQAEVEQARAEAQKLKDTVKEEEEKRVKAISLLKTVRQKLVKAEKDRDESIKEANALKEREKSIMERERAEKAKLEKEIETVRSDKERDITGLKAHFDRELVGMREKLEKEFAARKGQLELDASATKASFQKEITAKNSKIQTLENSVRSLNSERDSLFDQLQLRQAELESSQSHLDSLQSSTSELQFQLREVTDRSSLLAEELADAQRELEYSAQRPSVSEEDTARIRAASEAKYEVRISELTSRLAEVERDRNDTETALSKNLQQKTQEIEALRRTMEASSRNKGVSEEELMKLRREIEGLQHETSGYKQQLSELDRQRDRVNELEAQLQRQSEDFKKRSEQQESEVAEAKEREIQIRASNKTLREELRKVQSSAALLERQRNPGVGYWSNVSRHDSPSEATLSSPSPSTSDLTSLSRVGSPAPIPAGNDEEVNLEYLRNVILQFLEHKDMRPHLVRVLSIILHFTPQETRRLIAKV